MERHALCGSEGRGMSCEDEQGSDKVKLPASAHGTVEADEKGLAILPAAICDGLSMTMTRWPWYLPAALQLWPWHVLAMTP